MSTHFRFSDSDFAIQRSDLLEVLGPHGISLSSVPEFPSARGGMDFGITDGSGLLWCCTNEDGLVDGFIATAQLKNPYEDMLEAIGEHVHLVLSEHDEGYWEGEEDDEEEPDGNE